MAQAKRKNTTKPSRFDYRGFGHRLRVTRIMLGLTEEEAAAAAGCTVYTWRKYEYLGSIRCRIRHTDYSEPMRRSRSMRSLLPKSIFSSFPVPWSVVPRIATTGQQAKSNDNAGPNNVAVVTRWFL